jgi:hypothetical protein
LGSSASKTAFFFSLIEAGMPVVREEWLLDSIEKQEPQPMEADDVSDLFVEGKGIPWDKQYPEAPKSISAEVKGFLSRTSNNYS